MRGDQNAWETLVRSHAGLVYAVVRRCGLHGDEAADLFQEVWLAVWNGLGSLRDEGRLTAWLVTVAARQARRGLKRRVRASTASLDGQVLAQPDPGPLPDEVAIDRERGSAVRMAIGKLSERDRRIVEYFFYDPTGPSYAEIAARLGVSADTIGPLRTRCLRRLREALEDASALADPDTDHCAEG